MTIEMMQAGFALLSLVMAVLLVEASRRAGGTTDAIRTAVAISLWLAVTAGLAQSGVLTRFDLKPPAILRLLLPTMVMTVLLAFSPWGTRLIRGLPLWVLVAAQSFRIPVELLLLGTYKAGGLPVQMTFEGRNFDVLTGLLALVVAWQLRRRPAARLVRSWNFLGLALLATIVVIANLSAPTPYRVFHEGPSSALIATSSFIWLPTFLVQLALLGHLLVFRRLAIDVRAPVAASSGTRSVLV